MARIMKLDSKFIEDLKCGVLSDITNFVKKRKDLLMSFRDGRVNVYYKGHSLFEISESQKPKGYKISFDIGHARYTDYYKNIENELKKLNSEIKTEQKAHKKEEKIYSYSYSAKFYVCSGKANNYNLVPVMQRYIQYVDDFLNDNKQYDYFKAKEVYDIPKKESKGKKYPLERVIEQEYMVQNNNLKSDYYLIDMEYSVKGLGYGRFDMIGISKKKNSRGKHTIALIELKSGTDSIKGTFTYSKKDKTKISSFGCGVAGHIVNYYKFLYGKESKKNIERLSQEISFAIAASHKLGVNLNIPKIEVKDIDAEADSVKCLLIITDLNKDEKKRALSLVGSYIFSNADRKSLSSKISKYCLDKNWDKNDKVKVTSFTSDYNKLDMKICLCDKERNIEDKNFRRIDLEELEKWQESL